MFQKLFELEALKMSQERGEGACENVIKAEPENPGKALKIHKTKNNKNKKQKLLYFENKKKINT